jgi:hypothetical protein
MVRRFFFKKNYKKHFFYFLKLNRYLRFLDIYKTNVNKRCFDKTKIKRFNIAHNKQLTLFRYLRFFHFMYYLKFKKIFGFEKINNKPKLYSHAFLKVLKKNIFLLY